MTLPGTLLVVLIFFLCLWLTNRDIPDFHKGRKGWRTVYRQNGRRQEPRP